jgi:hypothetical protein
VFALHEVTLAVAGQYEINASVGAIAAALGHRVAALSKCLPNQPLEVLPGKPANRVPASLLGCAQQCPALTALER